MNVVKCFMMAYLECTDSSESSVGTRFILMIMINCFDQGIKRCFCLTQTVPVSVYSFCCIVNADVDCLAEVYKAERWRPETLPSQQSSEQVTSKEPPRLEAEADKTLC